MHAAPITQFALALQAPPIPQPSLRPKPLYLYLADPDASLGGHDLATKARVAESLAAVLGCAWAGPWRSGEAGPPHRSERYLVPSDAIVGLRLANELGVNGVDDLFGGVVPHAFVATKLITHPLVHADSPAPPGWSPDFAERTVGAVLPGYSVFCARDALEAGDLLLQGGTVRVKHPHGVGGHGQWVVSSRAELKSRVSGFRPADLLRHGLVLERNLKRVTTHSVGQVQVGRLIISYHGTQTLTVNHRGQEVYGGSTLNVVRGGFEELVRHDLPGDVRRAVAQAVCYHHAAMASFRGMFASRSNYDVAQGVDDAGRPLSGVLEQSWRIGGASGAEAAALHAFDADPALTRLVASTHELYGSDVVLPPGAWLLYDGVDPRVGRLVKYAQVGSDVHA